MNKHFQAQQGAHDTKKCLFREDCLAETGTNGMEKHLDCYRSRKGNLRNQTGAIVSNTIMMAQRLEKMAEKLAVPRLACAMCPPHSQRLNVTPTRELFICPAESGKKTVF